MYNPSPTAVGIDAHGKRLAGGMSATGDVVTQEMTEGSTPNIGAAHVHVVNAAAPDLVLLDNGAASVTTLAVNATVFAARCDIFVQNVSATVDLYVGKNAAPTVDGVKLPAGAGILVPCASALDLLLQSASTASVRWQLYGEV